MLQRWSDRLKSVLSTHLKRGALFVLATLMVGSLTLSPVLTPTANAQGLSDLLSLTNFTNGLSSCAIETVGWVICPTMRSIARLADYGFTYINQNFLRIDYGLFNDSSGTFKAWGLMRTVANALFVVAFMILIYSQLTGRGGGYNLKRLIPRLLISAVLVNLSYYLCVFIIDLTNILGDSILSVLKDNVAASIGRSVMPISTSASATGFKDGTLTTITSSVLSKTGTAWVLLAPVAAVVISIAVVCAAGVVLLIMRKTVIAMLILASPILFVAYLLPNLERYFFQGVRLFMQLILLYPIIAFLLGAGQIVSATIVTAGTNDANYRASGDSYFSLNGGSGSAITDVTAAGAAVLPLLGVWFIFKNMNSIMSTAGSRLSASIAGRRGGKDDEKARVTGNATVGAANNKNLGGLGGPRRQAYSRNRRHASLGGSSLPEPGTAGRQPQPSPNAAQNALDSSIRGDGEDTNKQLEGLQDARAQAELNGDLNSTADISGAALQTMTGGAFGGQNGGGGAIKTEEKDKQLTAKDLFNNMNRSHDSKDKDRKFSAGPAPAGGGGGQASGGAAPSAPTVAYRAPQMAQSSNIITGGTPVQPVSVVAVPVQVNPAELLGQHNLDHTPSNSGVPVSGTEEKAKARAQKYLFDTEQDLDDARNREDILGHKNNDAELEQPHVSVSSDEKKGVE
ncbi:MAG TPA: hypothetical protein VMT96_00285 [Candidatus Bathyarchaeia archaeon]|nr:hypothetical protein [Candidatus Bathyarchaeia archaeon]